MTLKELQAALGVPVTGIMDPPTVTEILAAAHEQRLTAIARVPAPVTGVSAPTSAPSRYTLGSKSRAQLALVHPKLQTVVGRAIMLTSQDFAVHDGGRTAAEQNALYQQGRTKPGKIVTDKDGYKNKSNHQIFGDGFGHSVDLVPYVPGRGLVWDETWAMFYPIAVAMAQASKDLATPIRWGGNWYEQLLPGTVADMKASVERYKAKHPGPDFIDGPHFELV